MAPNVTPHNGTFPAFDLPEQDEQPLDLTLGRPSFFGMTSPRNSLPRRASPKLAQELQFREEMRRKRVIASAFMNKRVADMTKATFTFCTLLNAYEGFCAKQNLEPLDCLSLLKMAQTEFTEDVNEDQDSNKVEGDQEDTAGKDVKLHKSQKGDESLHETCQQLTLNEKRQRTQSFSGIRFKATKNNSCFDEEDSCDSGFESVGYENESHLDSEVGTSKNKNKVLATQTLDFNSNAITFEAKESKTICEFASEPEKKPQTFEVSQPKDLRSKTHESRGDSAATTDSASKHPCRDQPKPLLLPAKSIKREFEADEPERSPEDAASPDGSPADHERAKRGRWSDSQQKIITNVISLLDLKDCQESSCYGDGKVFSQVLIEMMKRKQLSSFLSTFAHSVTCKEKHVGLCFMFKRVLHHVTTTKHRVCAVKSVYGHVLRLHLDTCASDECGFPKCKSLRESRATTMARGSVGAKESSAPKTLINEDSPSGRTVPLEPPAEGMRPVHLVDSKCAAM